MVVNMKGTIIIYFVISWFTLNCSTDYSKEHFDTKPPRKRIIFYEATSHLPWLKKSIKEHYKVYVDSDAVQGNLHHFWKSTGLCPPDPHQEAYKFLLSDDMKQNFAYIGSLPQNGILQVRIHWLLNLAQMRLNYDGTVTYNFTYLDELINMLWKYNLKPGFELMGNPSQVFSDFENSTQVFMWKNLVKSVASHYIALYGISYVSQWNFETWNEPDHHDFDGLNFTTKGFMNYYDACSEGLNAADKILKLGGPGGSCHIPHSGSSPICWKFLKHCHSGKNFFTGDTGVRLNFISVHKKGNGSSTQILKQEVETINFIKKHFPKFINTSFCNDEADPLKTWSLPQWWRSDVTYAAMVAKVIVQHLLYYNGKHNGSENINFGLLSNDNAFLSYFPNQFNQRTLLARFQINNTNPPNVQFVKKPVYAAMGLLGKLGSNILKAKIFSNSQYLESSTSKFGVLATNNKQERLQLAVLIYNSDDVKNSSGIARVKLVVNSSLANASDVKCILYELNNLKNNPYAVWKMMGSPAFPNTQQFALIKDQEDPYRRLCPGQMHIPPPWHINLKVQLPGVSLVHICSKSLMPEQVKNVQLLEITNTTLLITWQDSENRCILTYNVEHKKTEAEPFKRINTNKTVFFSFWYSCHQDDTSCSVEGYYRIQAIDYWKQHGPYSKPVKFCL